MPVVKKAKRSTSRTSDPNKERIFKGLSTLFSSQGYNVRREELKRGPGWRASSGSCRKVDERIVFVDKRSPIEDQIGFLVQEIMSLNISHDEESLSVLPEESRELVASVLKS